MIFFASQPRGGGSMVEIGSGFPTSSAGKRQTMWKSGFGRKAATSRSTNNAGCDVVCFQIWFVLEPDGLFLFPYSWKKETKRAAADE